MTVPSLTFRLRVPFLSPPYKSVPVGVVKSSEEICCANTTKGVVKIPILNIAIDNEDSNRIALS